jgi:hypothetical protein
MYSLVRFIAQKRRKKKEQVTRRIKKKEKKKLPKNKIAFAQ